MLTGPSLGAAIEAARVLKGVTKKALADHFGVTPPSVQDWVNRGTIDKEKLPALWNYFSDVVDIDHWGLGGTSINPASPAVTLELALDVIGQHLARDMDRDTRAELGEALAAWARWGGKPSYRDTVAGLLAGPAKRAKSA